MASLRPVRPWAATVPSKRVSSSRESARILPSANRLEHKAGTRLQKNSRCAAVDGVHRGRREKHSSAIETTAVDSSLSLCDSPKRPDEWRLETLTESPLPSNSVRAYETVEEDSGNQHRQVGVFQHHLSETDSRRGSFDIGSGISSSIRYGDSRVGAASHQWRQQRANQAGKYIREVWRNDRGRVKDNLSIVEDASRDLSGRSRGQPISSGFNSSGSEVHYSSIRGSNSGSGHSTSSSNIHAGRSAAGGWASRRWRRPSLSPPPGDWRRHYVARSAVAEWCVLRLLDGEDGEEGKVERTLAPLMMVVGGDGAAVSAGEGLAVQGEGAESTGRMGGGRASTPATTSGSVNPNAGEDPSASANACISASASEPSPGEGRQEGQAAGGLRGGGLGGGAVRARSLSAAPLLTGEDAVHVIHTLGLAGHWRDVLATFHFIWGANRLLQEGASDGGSLEREGEEEGEQEGEGQEEGGGNGIDSATRSSKSSGIFSLNSSSSRGWSSSSNGGGDGEPHSSTSATSSGSGWCKLTSLTIRVLSRCGRVQVRGFKARRNERVQV